MGVVEVYGWIPGYRWLIYTVTLFDLVGVPVVVASWTFPLRLWLNVRLVASCWDSRLRCTRIAYLVEGGCYTLLWEGGMPVQPRFTLDLPALFPTFVIPDLPFAFSCCPLPGYAR